MSGRCCVGALMLAMGLVAGCATTPPPATHLKMEPVVVRPTDPLTGLAGYDAFTLLELGNEEFEGQRYERALAFYERLIAEFADSRYRPATLYNAGLSHEKLEKWAPAATYFGELVAKHRGTPTHKDAHFRYAFVLGKLERWVDVADTFWAVRQLDGLTTVDELEARVGQGVGMFMQEDYLTAEQEFRRAITFYDSRKKAEFIPADYWVGQSRFYLGEIYARQFEAIKLSTPDAKTPEDWVVVMGSELEQKCKLLLRAQNNFIRAIRVGHNGWATASGFRIGSLYETLYNQLMSVPVPPELDDGATEFYRDELKRRVSVLVMKAIQVYETSLNTARRIGENNDWVEKTSVSLERMKALYLAEANAGT